MTEKDGKTCSSNKKMILISKWCAEHPFAGQNTQHLILFNPRKHEQKFICKQLESTPIRPGRSIDVHVKVFLLKRSWQRARFVNG